MKYCSICRKSFKGYGHNPEPVQSWFKGSCCDECYTTVVIPTRQMKSKEQEK